MACFITFLFLAFIGRVAYGAVGPTCFECSRIPYPRDCSYVTRCGVGEVCSTSLILTDSGFSKFDLHCEDPAWCSKRKRDTSFNMSTNTSDDEPGDIHLCQECCIGEFCNLQGCGAQSLKDASARGPMCFSCPQHKGENTCSHIVQCRHGEECYMDKKLSPRGDILYQSGCKAKSICRQLDAIPSFIGKRSGPRCTGCCTEDYCNRNCTNVMSKSVPTSTTTVTITTPPKPTTPTKVLTTSNPKTQILHATQSPGSVPQTSGSSNTSLNQVNSNSANASSATTSSNAAIIPNSAITPNTAVSHNSTNTANAATTPNSGINSKYTTTTGISSSFSSPHQSLTTTTVPESVSLSSASTQQTTAAALAAQTTASPTKDASTTTISTTTLSTKYRCEQTGYVFVSEFHACYKIVTLARSWHHSRDYCRQDGGDLIVFHSNSENLYFDHLVSKLNPLAMLQFHAGYWIGASDLDLESQWKWLDGRPVAGSWFKPGEPNNGLIQQQGLSENCGELAHFIPDLSWHINDNYCSSLFYFICEKDMSVPVTTSLPTLSFPTIPATTSGHCRNADYTYSASTGICYKVFKTFKTRADARATCIADQSDLLILRNRDVELYFQQQNFWDTDTYHRFWLGGDRVNETSFEWFNGQKLDTSLQWRQGELSNLDHKCMTFRYDDTQGTIDMNDDACTSNFYSICEEKCPDKSYSYFPKLDYCIKLYDENVTWEVARKLCRAEGADLVEPTTNVKLAFLEWFINTTSNGNNFWVGANDTIDQGTFHWLNSYDVISDTMWQPGEPSIHIENQHCAAMWDDGNQNRKLNAINCHINNIGYICQYKW